MCIVFSIIGYVYWCLGVIFIEYVRYWEFVCELSEIPGYLYCSVISICEREEWPSPKDSESLSFPSLHSLLMWLHFMFDLSRSLPFFTYPLFRCRFYRCLWFISFPSHLILPLQRPISGSILRIIITHITTSSFCFIGLLIDIIFTLGILRSMAHGVHYTCCISYMRAWVLIIGYLSLVSFHFYHPITLAYVTSRVLRPPWGHGIRCRLRQPLLGQVIEIWLMFRYRHASSSGSRLFDV